MLDSSFLLVLNHIPLSGYITDMMKFGREDRTKSTVREEGRVHHGEGFAGLGLLSLSLLFLFKNEKNLHVSKCWR